ncbi:2-hydroxyhepta-2,4-diene-1,7-dioate isomerase [Putridiphycobacter roseus]|uniref:2-hydroxyhepta-2,4-diene-1,7-dioate isomerase n=1 Tax=Putridiphycobacter roseus TaxID=2219161 RepID=A0A2W1N2F5_9FLAO|nr:fumarylacetoacetate hydrolase family protein [Putridiphycobacter roseus]PZE18024.1 2-hydroxyhepta-2,4-diene-1,7-dioate isomerase [Putridiphycobacter roseus]
MKIICIGRNYGKHAIEMGASLPTEPIFFMKPDAAINRHNFMYYPSFTKDLHHEVEIVVKINKVGKHISPEFAHTYYEEIGLGLDFTARDIQKNCKEKGLPWEIAKAFDNSALISKKFISKSQLDLNNIDFSLNINEQVVQSGNTNDMLFNIDALIAYISQFTTLKMGDLIFTGTPEGVGPVKINDKLKGYIGDQEMFSLNIK